MNFLLETRAAYAQYKSTSLGAKPLASIETSYKAKAVPRFVHIEIGKEMDGLNLSDDAVYDLLRIKTGVRTMASTARTALQTLKDYPNTVLTLLLRFKDGFIDMASNWTFQAHLVAL